MSLFDKFSQLATARAELGAEGTPPVATPIDDIISAAEGVIDGKRVVLAGTNNYLGLTLDPDVVSSARQALEHFGTGTTGSRMANGSYNGHAALEQELASAFGWPSAMVFSTGYQANLASIATLAGKD
ncbi:MAG TPA: aminotransferase class I/II-fold pyridoxal phosphate-dependent enzyme, partial [Wenzhouxiangellaceae bacterium]|nr:aminotransferase class I/II-fold pyridoxal phosphate-dependent enzyme [Wenzhouxiangellaceae bacterium]